MYVLHHADQPSLYAGLPDNPHISVFVDAWKGFLKPLAVAGIAFTAVAGFLHWVVSGTNEVEPQDEAGGGRSHQEVEKHDSGGPRHELSPGNPDPQHRGRRGSTTGSRRPASCC